MINLLRKIFCLFIFYTLANQNILAFPGWTKEAPVRLKNPLLLKRLVTLKDVGKDGLITREAYIDKEYRHEVDKGLSKVLFGIDSITSPPTFVIEMNGEKTFLEKDGVALIDIGAREKAVIREFIIRWEFDYHLHDMFKRIDRLGTPKKFEGKVASIATKYTEGYYHFLFDMLPRLRLLQKSGLAYDKIYVSGMQRPYVKEALEIAEVDQDKIISGNDHPIITC